MAEKEKERRVFEEREVIHLCPKRGSYTTLCCERELKLLPERDGITLNYSKVTCGKYANV